MSDVVRALMNTISTIAVPPHYKIEHMMSNGALVYTVYTGSGYVYKILFKDAKATVQSHFELVPNEPPFAVKMIDLSDPDLLDKICNTIIRHFAYYRVPEACDWYNTTVVGEECTPCTHCVDCQPDGSCEACDTIDGRDFQFISDYASTCDECARPYVNSLHQIHPDDENSTMPRSYCPNCYYKLFRKSNIHSGS